MSEILTDVLEEKPVAPHRGRPGRKSRISQGATVSPAVNITFDQLQALMMQQAQLLATELRKPSDEVAAKLAMDKELRERHRNEMVSIARKEEELRAVTQANCNHQKENGKMAVGGQIFSDGKERFICLRCSKFVVERTPEGDSVAGGNGAGFQGW